MTVGVRSVPGPLSHVYVTYVGSTPEAVWDALTDADLTAAYWGHSNVSDWRPGSRWEHVRTDGSGVADVVGTVVVSDRPARLVTTWSAPEDAARPDRHSRVTFDIRPHGDIVRLTVTHEDLNDVGELDAASRGWPAVLSNLKSLIETGRPLPQEPWLMPDA
ncbi:SRPBCC family protein [Streptomyces sp. NPDC056160]|uniref:SRPBCC family protein n=1 Tax=Streptomyces sp. NPDC056160 TaxID=3345731 RepID=UPI0035DB3C8F